jgi:hypothetical protein
MPDTSPNELSPRFLKNLEALAAPSPALHELVKAVLAINDQDKRVFVSTVTNAHLYAGLDYLLRIEFPRGSELRLHRDTTKAISAGANKRRAEEFFREVYTLAMTHRGYKAGWADLNTTRDVLTLRGPVPQTFVDSLVALIASAPVEEEEEETEEETEEEAGVEEGATPESPAAAE